MSGVDSAFGPTLAQANAVKADGHLWWGWYACGLGAYHNWTLEEVQVIERAGFVLSLPIFVPRMALGRIHPDANPELDAIRTVWEVGHGYGWEGAVALDTEASMRGDLWTAEYERRFGDEVLACGWKPCTYAGGFTFSQPPVHPPWWIWPGAPPEGQARQWGQQQYLGLDVDLDHVGNNFPLATKVS